METVGNNKRECSASDDEERPKRPREEEGDDRKVTDEEVEEFYAILRRIREASRGFAVRNGNRGGGGGGRGGAASWIPAFRLEDFEESGAVKVNGTETPTNEAETSGEERRRWTQVAEGEGVAEDDGRGLDSNAEADTQGGGRLKREPGGDATAPLAPLSS
uniref:NRR repressor homolog 1 n=1 Tax=Elaeis guineensis var. tenera TaxID=51953 RepID=A0A6I9QDA0_ELAGV|nr:NRR repressor homolog 1 [Elaeis guineensis]